MMFKLWWILLSLVIFSDGLETPIIGILSQEPYIVSHLFPEHYDSFIIASYVKYVESAGGRVLPIWIGQTKNYYRRVVKYTNGIIFPGGGTYFNVTGGYGTAAKFIYQLALESNKQGIYYPVWGMCLGMQVLAFAALDKDIRVDCLLKNVAVPLNFTADYKSSRLFSIAPTKIINSLASQNLTYNFHKYCLTRSGLKANGLLSKWKILSTNNDVNELDFISTMESVDYPLYGIQFHPEKNPFEFSKSSIPHSKEAVDISQYFSSFLVEEAKKNNNTFPNKEMEKKSLIYNYNPKYTGLNNKSSFEQIYVFTKSDFIAAQLK